MNELGNRVYGVFWYPKSGEPQLLREFRSYKAALMHKLDMIDKCNDFNIVIQVRDVSDWYFMEEEEE